MKSKTSYVVPTGLLFLWLFATMVLWGFAFFKLPTATPEWILRAQSVCFGSSESGLPDRVGWMSLFVPSLFLLSALVIVFGEEILIGMGALVKKPLGHLFIIFIFMGLSLEAFWVVGRVQDGLRVSNSNVAFKGDQKSFLPENYLRTEKEAPAINLINQHGKKMSLKDLKGTTLLTFAFAHCQTVCPTIVKKTLDAASAVPGVNVLIVTLDPWRDTPGALPQLAEKWRLTPNAYVVSGDIEAVQKVIRSYGMTADRNTKTGNISHPALIYVIDDLGRLAYTFNSPPVNWVVEAAVRVGKTLQVRRSE